MKTFKIKVNPYNLTVNVVLFKNVDNLNKKYEGLNYNKEWSAAAGYYVDEKIYVFLNKNELNHGVIVHECVHLVNYIFKHINQNLDIDNDEAQAYLTQWLYNEIAKISKKHLKI